MKQRFSSLDVKVIAHELSNSLVTLRVANIYDLSTRIFLIKFARPNHREQLLIDSGFRCHLTSFERASAAAPTPFVGRLRKFLRTRRCTKVEQIGTDRVIELQFSDGAYRLFLEFYAGGNIVLTDANLVILCLLRSVNEGAEHEQYRVGLNYNLSLRQNFEGVPELTRERIREGLKRSILAREAEAAKPGKKIKKKGGDQLRKALAVTTHEFPPVLLDHALHISGYDRELAPEQVVASEELLDKLMVSMKEAKRLVQEITSTDVARGYIIAKEAKSNDSRGFVPEAVSNAQSSALFDDFHPFKPAHLASDPGAVVIEQDGFNKTADLFFSSLEGQRLESRLQEREDNAKRKIAFAKQEQAKRLDGLQQLQDLNILKAEAIQANVERVDEAVAAVNGLIAQGMDWVDIGRLIKNEQARGNPTALIYRLPLKLEENTVTLLLPEAANESDDEEMADITDSEASDSGYEDESQKSKAKQQDKRLAVDIDLASSAWSNARQYYDQKRSAAKKQERTAQASQKALKSTEQKVMSDLKKGLKQEKEVLRPVRKQLWFEKFVYFVSSEGYLVLAGRDAQQNELLYRRYLRKGDAYVHADLHGAASVIVKNQPSTPDAPIPPSTLGQAGQLAVCTSSAWDSKALMSAWWVNADQVSKTAPTGEYLSVGGFIIRGKKNFLPPAQLLLGFAVMFQISEESKARHVKHRLKTDDDGDGLGTGEEVSHAEEVGVEQSRDSGSDDELNDIAPDVGPNAADEVEDFHDALLNNDQENSTGGSVNGGEEEESDSEEHVAVANPLQAHSSSTQNAQASQTDSVHEDHKGSDSGDEKEAYDDGAGDESGEDDDEQISLQTETNQTRQQSTTTKPKVKRLVRGKKGKAKKLASKYADQDDEDRELAMRLLGSRVADDRRQAAAAEKPTKVETAEAARERRRAQHQRIQQKGLEAEEIRRLNIEEGAEDLDENEAKALTQLDSFVGTPLPGDEILEAIPVCAPWSALTKYKYKIKIQPGQQKKGKAVREILSKWLKDASDNKKVDSSSQDTEKIWPREADLIKKWKEAEIFGVVPVKSLRVVASGVGNEKGGGAKGKGGKGGNRGGRGSKRK